jgi:hypothetical protein
MGVTAGLSKRDRELARWFSQQGFKNPYLTVAALRKAKIKPQSAAALLEKESGKGRNIFGCDYGSCGDKPPYCNQNVTETRARRLRASEFANGVGPTQLTFKGFVDTARKRGGEWKPYYNMWTGFDVFQDCVSQAGTIQGGAARYNGGPNPNAQAQAYGRDFVAKRDKWERELHKAGFKV